VRDPARELADGLQPLRLPQARLQPDVMRDVGRDPAHAVDLAGVLVDQRELDRQERPRLLTVRDLLLELDRFPRRHHAQVVDPHPVGHLRREHFAVRPADQIRGGLAVQALEGPVDQEIPALRVLEEDRGGGVVEHRPQRPRVHLADDDELAGAHRRAHHVPSGGQLAERFTDRVAAQELLGAAVREHGDARCVDPHHGVGCSFEQLLERRGTVGHLCRASVGR
jgi:hypothetical protein